jgi:PAS domain S-box-containing protein
MKRIMIVDDEVIIATQLEERLNARGLEVVGIANDGEEALVMARELRPDLILMDVVMPGRFDGIAASELIHRELAIPVIFITAFANDELVERAKRVEPFGYILKPFREDQVLAAIEIAFYKIEMQKRLAESERRYRELFEGSPVGILQVTAQGRPLRANLALAQMLGYETPEALLSQAADLRDGLELAEDSRRRMATQLMRQGALDGLDVPYRRRDGLRITLSLSARVAGGGENHPSHIEVFVRDVSTQKAAEIALQQAHDELETRVRQRTEELTRTNAELSQQIQERVQAEQALKQSEEHLRSLMESASGFAVFRLAIHSPAHSDSDAEVVFVSPSIIELLGIDQPLNADSWFKQVHPQDREQLDNGHGDNMLSRARFDAAIRLFHAKRGQWRWIRIVTSGVPSDRDPPRYVNGILLDISASKEAEEALRESQHALASKSRNLEEMNTALKVLLKKRDEDRVDLEEKVLYNVKELIGPFMEKLNNTRLDANQRAFVEILESNLSEIISPFSRRMSSKFLDFTPTEIQIANMVKQGRSNKEIAQLLNVSRRTIESHRDSIRRKLGIKNLRANLRTHLLNIQ